MKTAAPASRREPAAAAAVRAIEASWAGNIVCRAASSCSRSWHRPLAEHTARQVVWKEEAVAVGIIAKAHHVA